MEDQVAGDLRGSSGVLLSSRVVGCKESQVGGEGQVGKCAVRIKELSKTVGRGTSQGPRVDKNNQSVIRKIKLLQEQGRETWAQSAPAPEKE